MNLDKNALRKQKEKGVCPLVVDFSRYNNLVSRNYLENKHYEQKVFDGAKILIFGSLKDVIEFRMMLESVYTDFDFILDTVEESSCDTIECKATIVLKRKTLEEITDSPEYKFAKEKAEGIKRLKEEVKKQESQFKNIENRITGIKLNVQKAISEVGQLKSLDKENEKERRKLKQKLLELNETLDELRSQLLKEGVVFDNMDITKFYPQK